MLLLINHTFCLYAGLTEKSKHVSSLGMDNLLDDVALQRHRLMRQYMDAESASLTHLEQVEAVTAKVAAILQEASEAKAGNYR